jgi:hypothetical protein
VQSQTVLLQIVLEITQVAYQAHAVKRKQLQTAQILANLDVYQANAMVLTAHKLNAFKPATLMLPVLCQTAQFQTALKVASEVTVTQKQHITLLAQYLCQLLPYNISAQM